MTLKIIPFTADRIDQAAILFTEKLTELRKSIPALPDGMQNPVHTTQYLEGLLNKGNGLTAVEGDRLVGYLAWIPVRDFRDTGIAAAYVPEWGHCAAGEQVDGVYNLLLNEAASLWAEKEYPIWAITCLSNNHFLETSLFRNGFGMIVQDAVRSIDFQAKRLDLKLKIRKCGIQDAELIAGLDVEHCDHYSRSPILMTTRHAETTESIGKFLAEANNSYWIAEEEGIATGFMRFESVSHGASAIVRSEKTVAITGAFTRPEYRGRGAATAILQYALADYARLGYVTCSVDYETINPQAYKFWTKYFQPVCFSAVRYPEKFLG